MRDIGIMGGIMPKWGKSALLGALAFVWWPSVGYSDTTTTNLGLVQPSIGPQGTPDWGTKLNTNFSIIDASVCIRTDLSGTGAGNFGTGPSSFANTPSGSFNTAFGQLAASHMTTGSDNTSVGYATLQFVSTGTDNTAMGFNAANGITNGTLNTCVGSQSCHNLANSSLNTAFGAVSLNSAVNAYNNLATGAYALQVDVSGSSNTAVGIGAGEFELGYQNTYVGTQSGNAVPMVNNLSLANNVAVGYSAQVSSSSAVAIGAFSQVTSSSSIAIGANAVVTSSNAVAIGYNATNNSTNTIQMGGTGSFAVTVKMSSASLAGFLQLQSLTHAAITALTPAAVGQIYQCSDCATVPVCISTGTALGAFAIITNKTSACQ